MGPILRIAGVIVVSAVLAACQKAIVKENSKSQPLVDLAGSEWGPLENPFDQFVQFRAEGEVSGSTGCNNFFGTYTQDGKILTLGPLATTRKACPADRMSAERNFLALFEHVRTVQATQFELHLFDETGEQLAALRRRDWD